MGESQKAKDERKWWKSPNKIKTMEVATRWRENKSQKKIKSEKVQHDKKKSKKSRNRKMENSVKLNKLK